LAGGGGAIGGAEDNGSWEGDRNVAVGGRMVLVFFFFSLFSFFTQNLIFLRIIILFYINFFFCAVLGVTFVCENAPHGQKLVPLSSLGSTFLDIMVRPQNFFRFGISGI
jgi:hypothetical protein